MQTVCMAGYEMLSAKGISSFRHLVYLDLSNNHLSTLEVHSPTLP